MSRRADGPAGIITGAASGIGAASALAMATLGSRMILASRSTRGMAPLVRSVKDAGGSGLAFRCDVRDARQVAKLAPLAVARFGRIDFLIASAGIAVQDTAVSGDVEVWRDVLLTNLYGLASCVRGVLPSMYEQGSGHLILISSLSGRHAYTGEPMYIASKWGVVGFGHSVRKEVASAGIKVTLIEPGLVDTPMTRESDAVRPLLDAIEPLEPEDVASAVVYAFTQPPRVVITELALRPIGQAEA